MMNIQPSFKFGTFPGIGATTWIQNPCGTNSIYEQSQHGCHLCWDTFGWRTWLPRWSGLQKSQIHVCWSGQISKSRQKRVEGIVISVGELEGAEWIKYNFYPKFHVVTLFCWIWNRVYRPLWKYQKCKKSCFVGFC